MKCFAHRVKPCAPRTPSTDGGRKWALPETGATATSVVSEILATETLEWLPVTFHGSLQLAPAAYHRSFLIIGPS
jgi:hypothetical protein